MPTEARRGRPPQITRDQIVDAALVIGLADFTMTSVAAALRVTPPALYSHVAGRAEILALAADRVLERIEAVQDPRDWRGFLRSYAVELRNGLAGVDWASVAELGRSSPAAVGIAERGLAVLTTAGFSPEASAEALWLVARVAISAGSAELPSLQQQRLIAIDLVEPSAEHPNLRAATSMMDASVDNDTLHRDLEVVLDGLAARLERHLART